MASIIDDPGGRRRISFFDRDGNRKTIRLGKMSRRDAEKFQGHVEEIVSASLQGNSPKDDTSRWIADLADNLHDRIARAGLTKPRSRSAATLGTFLADYFASLSVKAGTATAYGHTRRCLLEHFGEAKPLREIEPADADKWRQALKASGLSDATIARRVGVARMIFRKAGKWKLIRENPFSDVKAGTQKNKARQFFISRDVAQKVADACPDTQWRLLFALSRYGGLRCPSEHLALKWADVDFEHKRIRVPSPKTEHHEGMDSRVIPMFPELEPLLLDAFNQAEPGTEHVISRYRDAAMNLRTQLQRIIRKAGVTPWPKLWHNLRASRQTELAETYPIHVVCQWIGNSQAVAQDHYLQVTDAHFERATKAAQKAAQQAAQLSVTKGKSESGDVQNHSEIPADCTPLHSATLVGLGAVGFEPTKA